MRVRRSQLPRGPAATGGGGGGGGSCETAWTRPSSMGTGVPRGPRASGPRAPVVLWVELLVVLLARILATLLGFMSAVLSGPVRRSTLGVVPAGAAPGAAGGGDTRKPAAVAEVWPPWRRWPECVRAGAAGRGPPLAPEGAPVPGAVSRGVGGSGAATGWPWATRGGWGKPLGAPPAAAECCGVGSSCSTLAVGVAVGVGRSCARRDRNAREE